MRFSATHACPSCMLRFERSERCPGCGGRRVLALHTEEERADFRRLGRRARNVGGSGTARMQATLASIADWGPVDSRWTLGFGLLLFLPATFLLVRWGFSGDDALEVAGMAVCGAFLMIFTLATRIARRGAETSAPQRTLMVHSARAAERHPAKLRGVVRLASVTLESPLGGEACVAFGLHGEVNGAQLDDAEGGDFDLELESGERVMVSLQHAVLEEAEPSSPRAAERTPYLEELLEDRGLGLHAGQNVLSLAEVVVRDGDVVEVEGETSDGPALSFGGRAPSRVRVAAGDVDSPLVVRVGARREPTT